MMTLNDIIVLPVNDTIRQRTIDILIKKLKYTKVDEMYDRKPMLLLENLYMGDLAKNALIDYLRHECQAPIIDYDEVRTDNFMYPDPGWDMEVGKMKLKVEVKSSLPPGNATNQDILKNFDIKVTAAHDKDQEPLQLIRPEELESFIHVQIYFRAKNGYNRKYTTINQLYLDLVNNPDLFYKLIDVNQYDSPLFFGWTTRTDIFNYLKYLKSRRKRLTWTFPDTKRLYWVSPISSSFTLPQLIEYINKY